MNKHLLIFVCALLMVTEICATETSTVQTQTSSATSKNEFEVTTQKDLLLWAGYGFPNNDDEWDAIHMDEITRARALKTGLSICETEAKKGDASAQATLASYYWFANDSKRGLYWANQCAEQGDVVAMRILRCAYTNGEGVVKSEEEALKWLILAAAAGDKDAKDLLGRHENWLTKFERIAPANDRDYEKERALFDSSKAAARKWMKEHSTAFFNPDSSKKCWWWTVMLEKKARPL